MIYRLYVEKKAGYDVSAAKLNSDIKNILNIRAEVREFIRYDAENIDEADYKKAIGGIFSEPPVDIVTEGELKLEGYDKIVIEYLPGQYDQRADSAAQCIQLLTLKSRPLIRCARVIAVKGVTKEQLSRIKNYLINPVESREGSEELPKTLVMASVEGQPVEILATFNGYSDEEIVLYHKDVGFAMSIEDLIFVRDYFRAEGRAPTVTELKVIDTYWSDHCRHTTFLTELTDIKIESENPHIAKAYELYGRLFKQFNGTRADKYPCLMDIATIAVKKLKKEGKLDNLDVSDEINACSVEVDVDVDGKDEKWLIMFKNETHNHPTEIEPFGGAATCLGGAIRDPLSGRTYVYQAMRVTGCADPREPFSQTIKGKLPQRALTKGAAAGFSSYGNQIGLATGTVAEMYHQGYKAKRLEAGYVIGGAPKANVYREKPTAGDQIILLGGDTGRDGCGGATGSSKAHNLQSIESCGAEVQKGNPPVERKIQRLFRNPEAAKLIIKCNDFGAGGVSVAIGELAEGLIIDLDKVPKKYDGLDGTELAISESQERMAVVVKAQNVAEFQRFAAEENLNSTVVAVVSAEARMVMKWRGEVIVNLKREFLDTNGVKQRAAAIIADSDVSYIGKTDGETQKLTRKGDYAGALKYQLSRLNVCSQKGLSEMFDSTIGAASVLMPFGGKRQLTPSIVMAAKPPVNGFTNTATVSSYGCNPALNLSSPFIGAIYSIVLSLSKLVAAGVKFETVRLSLQEFFKKLGKDPYRWGEPLSALLGALYAEIGLDVGAIGGKDSMSGSFMELDVPPTLISFAMGIAEADKLITNAFTRPGKLTLLPIKRDEYNVPDFDYLKKLYGLIYRNIVNGKIVHATVTEEGGAAVAAVKGALGEGLGVEFIAPSEELFAPAIGDIIVMADEEGFEGFDSKVIGYVNNSGKITFGQSVLTTEEATSAFEGALEEVFPTTAAASGEVETLSYTVNSKISAAVKTAKPRVFIPVFPGTNCEYDTAKQFTLAGGKANTFVIKNQSALDIEASVDQIVKQIKNSQIIAFPGGFSGGDEPDGSGKFIATTFKNPAIADAVADLIENRDGLIIGICNGFQALIKLGLVPYGEIIGQTENSPTLTYNNISRHVSTISRIRVASNLSPWFNFVKTGEVYSVAISHGEGRFIAAEDEIARLAASGQIATQYVDGGNRATMESPYNPNGSMFAVEGITSADGRILGKMGHAERIGKDLYKNINQQFDMRIFEAGVEYFK